LLASWLPYKKLLYYIVSNIPTLLILYSKILPQKPAPPRIGAGDNREKASAKGKQKPFLGAAEGGPPQKPIDYS